MQIVSAHQNDKCDAQYRAKPNTLNVFARHTESFAQVHLTNLLQFFAGIYNNSHQRHSPMPCCPFRLDFVYFSPVGHIFISHFALLCQVTCIYRKSIKNVQTLIRFPLKWPIPSCYWVSRCCCHFHWITIKSVLTVLHNIFFSVAIFMLITNIFTCVFSFKRFFRQINERSSIYNKFCVCMCVTWHSFMHSTLNPFANNNQHCVFFSVLFAILSSHFIYFFLSLFVSFYCSAMPRIIFSH